MNKKFCGKQEFGVECSTDSFSLLLSEKKGNDRIMSYYSESQNEFLPLWKMISLVR